MREPVYHGGVEPDDSEKLLHLIAVFTLGQDHLVDFQGLADDTAGALPGVEGRIGVLEDKRHLGADFPQFLFREGGDIIAFKEDFALGRPVEAEDTAADGGLAAAAFAHQPQGLIAVHFKGDAVDCLDVGDFPAQEAAGHGEVHFQVLYVQYVFTALMVHFTFSLVSA